jgi:hypothetical protein
MDNNRLLRLLAEAFGKIKGWDAREGDATEAQLEAWLQQLLDIISQRDAEMGANSGTVVALHKNLKEQHQWLRLGQVYNALVYLREKQHS